MVHKCCNTTGTVGHWTDSSFLMHWFAALRQFVNALSEMSGINTLIHFEAGADVPLTRYTTGMALTSAGVCGGKVLRHVSSQQPGEKRRWYAPSPFCVSMSIVYQTTSSGLNAPWYRWEDDGLFMGQQTSRWLLVKLVLITMSERRGEIMDRLVRCRRHSCKTV